MVPGDRDGTSEPAVMPKGERRLDSFRRPHRVAVRAAHDGVRDSGSPGGALRSCGITGPDQPGHRRGAQGDGGNRQNLPLDPVYPVVFFDALRGKIRDEGLVRNKAADRGGQGVALVRVRFPKTRDRAGSGSGVSATSTKLIQPSHQTVVCRLSLY